MGSQDYIPPLHYRWLTRFYDPLVRWTTREATFKRALIEQVAADRPRCVLDLGCGMGTLSIAIARALPQALIAGLDADAEALALADHKAREARVRIALHRAASTEMPFEKGQFDCVVSSLFFHHLKREIKFKTLREVRRVLARGGTLHIADWGKPANYLMRALFVPVQLLDGFGTTRDSVAGILPGLIGQAGFPLVEKTASFATPLGTLALYRAH